MRKNCYIWLCLVAVMLFAACREDGKKTPNEQHPQLKESLEKANRYLVNDEEDDIQNLVTRNENLNAPEYVHKRIEREIKKLNSMSVNSSEYSIVRNYVETLLTLPWNYGTPINVDLKKAKEILDKEHYGLTKVKDRILEYLAVQSRADKLHGPIICLMGPPGIGKTS